MTIAVLIVIAALEVIAALALAMWGTELLRRKERAEAAEQWATEAALDARCAVCGERHETWAALAGMGRRK